MARKVQPCLCGAVSACRACWRSAYDPLWGGVPSPDAPPIPGGGVVQSAPPPEPAYLPCVYEGQILERCTTCQGEWRHVRDCSHPDNPTESCARNHPNASVWNCVTCPHRRTEPAPAATGTPSAGVVIGTYGWPKLAELQIRVIRQTCGPDTPILIADDGSPATADLARVCEQYPGVDFAGSLRRLGHYAGDLSVFRKGLEWAGAKGLTVLAKLSQRLLLTRPGWLAEAAALLTPGGPAETVVTSMVGGSDKGLYFRTEAVALRVADWRRPGVFSRLAADRLTNPTELLFHDIIQRDFHGRHLQWPGLAQDRYAASPGAVWHCTHPTDAYAALAARHGLTLDEGFYTAGHERMPGWQRG